MDNVIIISRVKGITPEDWRRSSSGDPGRLEESCLSCHEGGGNW